MKNKRKPSAALERALGPVWQRQEAIEKMTEPFRHLLQHQEAIQRALEGPVHYLQQHQQAIQRALEGPLQHLQQHHEAIQRALEGPLWHLQQHQEVLEKALGPFWQFLQQQEAFEKAIESLRLLPNIPREKWVILNMIVYFWPTSDNDLIDFIVREEAVFGSEIGAPVCKYYRENNWEKLGVLVERWEDCDLVADRFPILKSCFEILKNSSNSLKDSANTLIPALNCQFEGVVKDIKNIPNDKSIIEAYESDRNDEPILFGILSEIFKKSYKFASEKEAGENLLNINRHKLAHGGRILLDYGTEENLVRMFLYINEAIRFWETEQDKGKSAA